MMAVFRFSLGIVIPAMEGEFHLTSFLEGLFVAVNLLGMITASTFAGSIAARIDPDRTLIMGTAIMATNHLLLGFSPSFELNLMLAYFAGVGAGILVPSLYARVGTIIPKSRGVLVGITNGLFTFGGLAGALMTASLVAMGEWRGPFAIYGLVGGISVVAMLSVSPRLGRTNAPKIVRRENIPYWKLLTDRHVLPITGVMFTGNFGFITFLAFGPKYLVEVWNLDLPTVGLVIAVFSLFGGIGAIVTGVWSDKVGRRWLAVLVNVVAAASSLLIFLQIGDFLIMIILSAVFGFGALPFWNLQISAIQDLVEKKNVVNATALAQNMAWIGAAIGPAMAGIILLYLDFQPSLILTVSLAFMIGAVLSFIGKEKR